MATAKRTSDIYEDTVFWMSYPKPPKEMEE